MLLGDKIPSSENSYVSLSKNYTCLCFFFLGSMKFKETFSSLIIHLALPGRNIDNIYHVVQILVEQSLATVFLADAKRARQKWGRRRKGRKGKGKGASAKSVLIIFLSVFQAPR